MKMAVVEMLEKENRRERRKYIDIGKREGIKEGIKGVAKKLLNKKMSIEEVEEITGLKRRIYKIKDGRKIPSFYLKFLRASILSSVLGCVDHILEVFFLPSFVFFLNGFTIYILAVALFAVSN